MNLDEKLEKLVKLLHVCPQCLSGYIRQPKFKREVISGAACYPPVYETRYDTRTKSVAVKCSSGTCNNVVTFQNPHFKSETLCHLLEDEEGDLLEDEDSLFG